MIHHDKQLSFANTSRKHYYVHTAKQQQWMQLNYEAAQLLAQELTANPEGYLTYTPQNDHGCLLYKRAVELRKAIDAKLGIGNYLVGKLRESDHDYSLFNEDEIIQQHVGVDIFRKYIEKIVELYFPDEPHKVEDLIAHGFTRRNEIFDTYYKVRLAKLPGSVTYDNIILENPHWCDNNELIKNSIDSLQKAYASQTIQGILHHTTSARRNFTIATPYCSGTSSIADLVEKALFESKHIRYAGYIDHEVSRDVLAFLCPTDTAYEQEYSKLCTTLPTLENKTQEMIYQGSVQPPPVARDKGGNPPCI